MSRLRLALLAGDWIIDGPTGQGGGIETYVRTMARGLGAAGHDVHVIGRAQWHTRSRVDDGVHLHALHVPDEWDAGDDDLGEARAALGFAWHAWRHVRALTEHGGAFDLVEAPEYKAQGYYLSRDATVRLIVKCHAHLKLCLDLNGVPLAVDTALVADLERETLERAHAVHANSSALATRCATDYGLDVTRIATVPYGIDAARFRSVPSTWRATWDVGDAKVLLFVGRMEARKGIDTLVRAYTDLARRRDDVVLVVAGPDTAAPGRPSHRQWMVERWTAAGIGPDRYRLLGTVANDVLPAIYAASDVMVAPSPYEAFGLVYLEAMACGAVPIACVAGGAPEVVRDGITGMLVPPGDAPALAEAMERLLDSEPTRQRMAAAGRADVCDRFSLEAVVARTETFYREALA